MITTTRLAGLAAAMIASATIGTAALADHHTGMEEVERQSKEKGVRSIRHAFKLIRQSEYLNL